LKLKYDYPFSNFAFIFNLCRYTVARCHRIGQTVPVYVTRLVIAGTIEQRILDARAPARATASAPASATAPAPASATAGAPAGEPPTGSSAGGGAGAGAGGGGGTGGGVSGGVVGRCMLNR